MGEAPMGENAMDHNKGYEFIGFKVRRALVWECVCVCVCVCDDVTVSSSGFRVRGMRVREMRRRVCR